jgi:gluconate 5-dehydrogenase
MDDSLMQQLSIFGLEGRTALVMGGGGAIGSALAVGLAGAGARVAVAGRTSESLDGAVTRIRGAGAETLAIVADATDPDACARMTDEVVGRFGRLDIIVNAVGGGAGKVLFPAEEYPPDAWEWIYDLNVRSTLYPTQAAVRAMIAGGRGGRVLNISSVRSLLGINAGYSAYVAAKGAISSLTRQWATEWARHGITVNAISPTFVETPQVASLLADPSFREGLVSRIPLGRIGSTDDLVGPSLLFCSSAGAFVTGQVLMIDGGLTATQ